MLIRSGQGEPRDGEVSAAEKLGRPAFVVSFSRPDLTAEGRAIQ